MELKEQEIFFSSPSFSPPTRRWWSEETVAIVTGANKGIGFALVKRLAQLGLTVILTARHPTRGHQAFHSLKSQPGFQHLHFFPLDVSSLASIASFVSWFQRHFGLLDILVNNAAVSFNDIDENSVEHAETVMKTNFYGPKRLTEALLPFFRRTPPSMARVLNVSSRLGLLNKMDNPNIVKILQDEERLSEEHIESMVKLFLDNVKSGTWKNQGWPAIWTDYSVSKLALNAYSRVLAKRFEGLGLSVNCFCPGYTQTTMTGGRGTHTADTAAMVAAKLALLPPEELPSGKFYKGVSRPLTYSRL
ncbi:(+)-neomenthol dehydrogenase [Malania oleifera]|uniref:(+)-neomenthol dehydrogenase n=1 Tax=Malania oleifera TaxID=397392 RepID=UPI0025ADB582|nr:(+)-neomenthol dehydrogenase [Malania oleifera]